MVEMHAHNPFTCSPHVTGCDCPDPGNSLCNPYYVAGYCPEENGEDGPEAA